MGDLEGAGITVLGKGMLFPAGTDPFGTTASAVETGALPPGTVLMDGSTDPTHGCGTSANPYPSNFYCNPSSIDGLTIENSSQGGGGVFVHGWGHELQIANNRITNNSGTLTGGISVGRSEEHTSELQSLRHLVCRLLLEKKKNKSEQAGTHQDERHMKITDRKN